MSDEPKIVQFYEIISDNEIEKIKSLSRKMLRPSTLRDDLDDAHQIRLSATAWIHDNGENLDAEGLQLVERLNRRMEKLTGLTSSTAEAYQGKASNNS